MVNIFDKGEPLHKYYKIKKGKTNYVSASAETNESSAKLSAKNWRENGYKSFVKKIKGGYIVYIDDNNYQNKQDEKLKKELR